MSKFANMTVKELKEETKKAGLTLEYKGHKFKKSELIERLEKYYEVTGEVEETYLDLVNSDEEAKQTDKCMDDSEDWIQENPTVHEQVECEKTQKKHFFNIKFAETIDEIEEKYSKPKPQFVFDNELNVGSFVVFIHYVEAINGNIYKKLRTAKIVGVNRKKELVRVQTLLGEEKELPFEELLFIKKDKEMSYPTDIQKYLRKQRTENGRKLLHERFN